MEVEPQEEDVDRQEADGKQNHKRLQQRQPGENSRINISRHSKIKIKIKKQR